MIPDSSIPTLPPTRWASRLLTVCAIWAGGFYLLVTVAVLASHPKPDDRAIILMGAGLLLIWVLIGGIVMRRGRDRVVAGMRRIRLDWRVRFVLLCILMALIEEAITTTLTNLGPALGAETDAAKITASKNYLEVVLFNSVIIFVPMFVAWAWLLNRYAFRPAEVMLLWGLTGTLAEMMTFGASPLTTGFWVWVYGLMVYLPAHSVPPDRAARRVRPWHYPLALILPVLCAVPIVPLVLLARQLAGINN
jgi:hypothetical protein